MVLIGKIPEQGLLNVVTKTSLETTLTTLLHASEFLHTAVGAAVTMAVKAAGPAPPHDLTLEAGLVRQQDMLD